MELDRGASRAYLAISQIIDISIVKTLVRAGLVTLLVLPDAHKPVHKHKEGGDDGGDEDDDKAPGIAGCIVSLESKGADKVSCSQVSIGPWVVIDKSYHVRSTYRGSSR